MGILDLLRGSKNDPVCDVCNRVVSKGEGHCLSTRQVVMESRYWEHTFTHSWNYLGSIDPEGRTLPMIVAQQGGQDSAWLVCNSCISLFQAVDRSSSRAICQEWWKTGQKSNFIFPGVGPILSGKSGLDSLRDATIPAAEGWSNTFGSFPDGILEEPSQSTLAALDKHNPGLGTIVRQKSQAFFGALKKAAPAPKTERQVPQSIQTASPAPTVPPPQTSAEHKPWMIADARVVFALTASAANAFRQQGVAPIEFAAVGLAQDSGSPEQVLKQPTGNSGCIRAGETKLRQCGCTQMQRVRSSLLTKHSISLQPRTTWKAS